MSWSPATGSGRSSTTSSRASTPSSPLTQRLATSDRSLLIMEGASRQSLAAVRRRLDDLLREPANASDPEAGLIQRSLARLRAATGTGPDPAQLAAELFAVADLLHTEAGLRRALADPGSSEQARVGLLERVLSGKVSDDALEVLRWAVASRWSRERDLE